MITLRIGQTITKEIMAECKEMPPAALREIWIGRTINKAALMAIEAAIKDAKPTKTKKAEESKPEPEGE